MKSLSMILVPQFETKTVNKQEDIRGAKTNIWQVLAGLP